MLPRVYVPSARRMATAQDKTAKTKKTAKKRANTAIRATDVAFGGFADEDPAALGAAIANGAVL